MKSCPTCNRTYPDDSLAFCLVDGSILSAPFDPEATQRITSAPNTNLPATEILPKAASSINNSPTEIVVSPSQQRNKSANISEQKESSRVSNTLLHSPIRKFTFAIIAGFLSLLITLFIAHKLRGSEQPVGEWLFYTSLLGAVYGLVITIVILIGQRVRSLRSETVIVGAITGGLTGWIVRLLGSGLAGEYTQPYGALIEYYLHFLSAVGADIGGSANAGGGPFYLRIDISGGWLLPIIFGAVLGVALGFIYRSSRTRDVV